MRKASPIGYAATSIPGGALADRFGRRRIYLIGIGVFAGGALLGSLAQGAELLTAGRAIQGVGSGLAQPSSLALLATVVHRDRLSRAVAMRSGASAAGTAAGPLVGAVLVALLGWRSVLWTSIPVAVVAAVAAVRVVGESRARQRRAVDWFGAVLVAAAVTLFCKGAIDLGEDGGWAAGLLVGLGLLAGAGFVLRLATARVPLVDPRALRRRPVPLALAVGLTVTLALTGALFLQQVVAQSVIGLSPLTAGLLSIPITVLFIVGTAAAPRSTKRFGLARVTATGLFLGAVGLGVLATISETGVVQLAVGDVVLGLGLGLALPGLWAAALAGAPEDDRGAVSGGLGLAQHLGQAIGVAAFAALTAAVTTLAWRASSVPAGQQDALLTEVLAGDVDAVSAQAGPGVAQIAGESFLRGNTVACLVGAVVLVVVAIVALRRASAGTAGGQPPIGPMEGEKV
ncbi:MFS transporter [Nakamurella multipartita]|uniref:Major facilitator superfamily MFS_1 n=1 Tax=Nakamurella multipartita (strain ATCC 700099 / DSM 44233 / CIP 104796 / JCM 9543 / NBRC 105858 / Y-104) TaxID=479431 RepID=C8X7K0_NAKMY|nr:MFS transporter [Nakamurella multipartita]ACV78953.1 major facilitator superfamily MFS_1 [Nakamurella multipartita DSM 44233]